jgi:anti-sigma factor RsiW
LTGPENTNPADELVCRQVVELVTDYLEGALSPADRARFEAHLSGCRSCRSYLDQIRSTIGLVSAGGREAPSQRAKDDLLRLFRRWTGQSEPGDRSG